MGKVKSTIRIPLDAALAGYAVEVNAGAVSVTDLTAGATVRIAAGARDAPQFTVRNVGTLNLGGERVAKVYITADALAGGVLELTAHDCDVDVNFNGAAASSAAAASVLLASLTPGEIGTGAVFDSSGTSMAGSGTNGSGTSTKQVQYDSALEISGMRHRALNAGWGTHYYNTVRVGLLHLFGTGGSLARSRATFGRYAVRDTVWVNVTAPGATSTLRTGFWGYGGIGNTKPFGIGFYTERHTGVAGVIPGNKRWRALAKNHDGVSATTFYDVDLGIDADTVHELELVLGYDTEPFAEFWIDGVLRHTARGVLAGLEFGSSHTPFTTVVSSNGFAGQIVDVWNMIGAPLTFTHTPAA